VSNATFNNISAILWRPVLVVEEAGTPGENHRVVSFNDMLKMYYVHIDNKFIYQKRVNNVLDKLIRCSLGNITNL
jgi:hypothetical protein